MRKFDQFVRHNQVLQKTADHLETLEEDSFAQDAFMTSLSAKYRLQFDLGWKILKTLLEKEGAVPLSAGSPRAIIKQAYAIYPWFNGPLWLKMLDDRNHFTHIYEDEPIFEYTGRIMSAYIPEFDRFAKDVQTAYGAELEEIR